MSKADKRKSKSSGPTSYTIGVSTWYNGSGVIDAKGTIISDNNVTIQGINDGKGRIYFTFSCPPVAYKWGGDLLISAEGFKDFNMRVSMDSGSYDISMELNHFDPSGISLEELAKIKGSMWCRRMNLPFGPRPNQDDNILAMDYFEEYPEDLHDSIVEEYKKYGNTHYVTGPLVDSDGYHGQYPTHPYVPTQEEFDRYLDIVQYLWDKGLTPVHFCHPDNWDEPEMMAPLDALYSQPRAQKLLRIVVYTGWEPTKYGWPNSKWVEYAKRAASVFPNALRLVHTVTDTDAPTGMNDYLIPGWSNGIAWQNIAPYIHGWLVQNAGYFSPLDRNDPGWQAQYDAFKVNFPAQFSTSTRGSLAQRFRDSSLYQDWPKFSAFGPNIPLKVYAGEFAAFPNYWGNWPEDEARFLAKLALDAGADGFLDGGA